MSSNDAQGPFPYCDYWASVLKLTNVISDRLRAAGYVSMDLFRKGLDRPTTKVPKLRYYFLAFMFGPGMVPYKVALFLAMLFRPKSKKKLRPKVDLMLEDYNLGVEVDHDDPRWATVSAKDGTTIDKILNPDHVTVSSSLFFHTYKFLIAVLLTIVVTSFAIPRLPDLHPIFLRYPDLSLGLYPLMFLGLYLMLRDLWTALLAPLPLLVARWLFSVVGGIPSFLLAMAGLAVMFYLVEWFFIPRSTAPALYLYVNNSEHPLYPYRPGHEPYWLEGTYYWVWRFVLLAPAEITKFWEKDWERLEVWVRADPGEYAGRIEWLVTDAHYRELWFRYERETTPSQRRRHEDLLRRNMARGGEPVIWVVEYDLNFLFHTPDVRGVFATTRKNGNFAWTFWRLVRALGDHSGRDKFADFRDVLEDLEAEGENLASDIPEHFQALAVRNIVGLPWVYWRYAKGAGTSAKVPAYNPAAVLTMREEMASERRYQIKAYSDQEVHG